MTEHVAANGTKKLWVHLHLYYQDQWPYFQEKLSHISGCTWDLCVTLTHANPTLEEQIRQFKPNALIRQVANMGYDIWPFLQTLYLTDLSQYDYVLKLHTKQPSLFTVPETAPAHLPWREALVEPLLGTPAKFQYALHCMQQGAGLCCAGLCVLQRGISLPEDTWRYTQLLHQLQLHSTTRWFVAGSIFLIQASCLLPLQTTPFTERDFSPTSHSNATGSLAHAIERIFLVLALSKNKSISLLDYTAPPFSIHHLKKYMLLQRYKFMYHITKGNRKICYAIKVNTLHKYLKRVL